MREEYELLLAEINAHRQDIHALSQAYAGIPVELPPKKDIWGK